jgi:hypothetical protein
MSDTVPGHVFISYVREDAAAADGLQDLLQAAGIRVWSARTSWRQTSFWKRNCLSS